MGDVCRYSGNPHLVRIISMDSEFANMFRFLSAQARDDEEVVARKIRNGQGLVSAGGTFERGRRGIL